MPFVMAKYHYDRHGNYQGKTTDGSGGGVIEQILGVGLAALVVLCFVYPALLGVLALAIVVWWFVRYD